MIMATRKTAAKPAETSGTFNLADKLVRSATGVVRSRKADSGPNPTLDSLKWTVENGEALAYEGLTEGQAKDAVNLLQRGCRELRFSLAKSTKRTEDGTYTVDFQASTKLRKRTYTAADIRAWAAGDGGFGEVLGPIPQHVRDAYKAAHGIKVVRKDAE